MSEYAGPFAFGVLPLCNIEPIITHPIHTITIPLITIIILLGMAIGTTTILHAIDILITVITDNMITGKF